MKIVRYELSQYRYPTFLVVNLKAVRWVDLESLSENFVTQFKDSAIRGFVSRRGEIAVEFYR